MIWSFMFCINVRTLQEEWNNTLERIFSQDKPLQGTWQSQAGCPTSPVPVRMSKGLQAQNIHSDVPSPSAMKVLQQDTNTIP